jgi:hypothetical protein
VIILVPSDEYQARVELIAWLAYPANNKLRDKARERLGDLARAQVGQKTTLRLDRLDGPLQRIDIGLSRNLLCGEIFRRQLFDKVQPTYGIEDRFAAHSNKAFYRRAAEGGYRSDEREGARMMSSAAPILHLAIGACDGLAERPGLLTRPAQGQAGTHGATVPGLLFNDTRHWTRRAVDLAIATKRRALELDDHRAVRLADLSVFPIPPL